MFYIQASLIDRVVKYSFLLMCVVGMILPSDGNHSFFAPKSLAFLNAFFWFFLYVISRPRLTQLQAWTFLIAWLAITFCALWFVVGINQNPLIASGQFGQFKILMTTLFVPLSAAFLIQDEILSPTAIMRSVLYANALYCISKVLLMALHVLGVINVWTVMHTTGLRYMSMHIIGELGRIQTSIDIATPYLVFFALQTKVCSSRFNIAYTIIAALSVFLSFSRLLIFGFFLSLCLYAITLKLSKQLRLWAIMAACFASIIAFIGLEKVGEVIEKRLFSLQNEQSDDTRKEQIDAMMASCDENPLFGQGLGGYSKECIRDVTLPYAYEVQWVSFLMQFGIIGICGFLLLALLIAWNFITPPWTFVKMGYALLWGLWLVSGFTNPFLISLTSGIVYMLFWMAGKNYLISAR